MTRVVITALADADMEGILAWLAGKAGNTAASRYAASFERLFERLAIHPAAGAPRPVLGASIRIGIVAPYIVIYQLIRTDNVVVILRVVHGRRKIAGSLL